MKRFIEQQERSQVALFPERLDDYVNKDNPVRVVDVFVESLHLATADLRGIRPDDGNRLYFSVSLWRESATPLPLLTP